MILVHYNEPDPKNNEGKPIQIKCGQGTPNYTKNYCAESLLADKRLASNPGVFTLEACSQQCIMLAGCAQYAYSTIAK